MALPPLWLAPPPLGNSGSATAFYYMCSRSYETFQSPLFCTNNYTSDIISRVHVESDWNSKWGILNVRNRYKREALRCCKTNVSSVFCFQWEFSPFNSLWSTFSIKEVQILFLFGRGSKRDQYSLAFANIKGPCYMSFKNRIPFWPINIFTQSK